MLRKILEPLGVSVIIPTYQRREVVLWAVRTLTKQDYHGQLEVIVVVDGSTDGTVEALRALQTTFPLTVLEQPNSGAAFARNHGASIACGNILLFLDDDMIADSRLLTEHECSHNEGADIVLGHIPLHPGSPCNVLSIGVESWAYWRGQRLSALNAKLTLHDLLTGQISISRKTFQDIGGFDINFTHDGSFGGEDIDFGYRLMCRDYKIVFNPEAISHQYYVVEPRHYLRQWRQAGHADVTFARKHPEQAKTLFKLNESEKWINRWVWRPLLSVPTLAAPVAALLRSVVLALMDRGSKHAITNRLIIENRAIAYWSGVREAGGIPKVRPMTVLAYHAIADLKGVPLLEPYAVPPDEFKSQLDTLFEAGYRFVSADEFLRFLQGQSGLPKGALLLTFDDCYEDLLEIVLPILKERCIPAVAFAVSGCVGNSNTWDQAIGTPKLRLLHGDGLRELAKANIEIGAHSKTHRNLKHISDIELNDEITGSVSELESLGLNRPRLFAYPYGEYDLRTQKATRRAKLQAAFTVSPGRLRIGQNPYTIPRIEILRGDLGWRLRFKVALAGRSVIHGKQHEPN